MVFSILATVIEVPILSLLGVFPAAPPSPWFAAEVRILLSFGIQGGVIRYWAVIALHAAYRSQKNAKSREREAFLNAAFELAATKGMADVTVNKVSELADVTKGAFFHHFDSKEALVTELMQMLLDKQFDRLMAEEENSDGCFTRAYIRAAFSEGAAERKIWGALLSLMASKDQVGSIWDNWLGERLKRHSRTDSRIELRVIRLAADGVWFERIMDAKSKNLKGVEKYLIEMTRR